MAKLKLHIYCTSVYTYTVCTCIYKPVARAYRGSLTGASALACGVRAGIQSYFRASESASICVACVIGVTYIYMRVPELASVALASRGQLMHPCMHI